MSSLYLCHFNLYFNDIYIVPNIFFVNFKFNIICVLCDVFLVNNSDICLRLELHILGAINI